MNPEDVAMTEQLDDGRDGVLPPGHPAQGADTVTAGEVLSDGTQPRGPGSVGADDTGR